MKQPSAMSPRIPSLVAGVMLLLAIPPIWPYGYYTLLRLVVCAVGAYCAWYAKEQENQGWLWTMVVVAVLFNPLIPVHLTKGIWVFLNLGAAVLFFVFSKLTR